MEVSFSPVLLAAGKWTPGLMILAGVVVLLLWAMIALRRKLGRIKSEPSAAERIAKLKSGAVNHTSVESVMVDAQELTRRLAAHLDNKASRMESLITEADARIAELDRRLGAGSNQRTHAHRSPGRTASMMEATPTGAMDDPNELDPLNRQIYSLSDEGVASIEIARRLDEQIGKVELILALRQ